MWRALLQVSLAAGLTAGTAAADEWTKRFTVSGKPELRVDANDGSVIVRTWDRKEIEARVTTVHWRIPADIQVVDHQTGDRVDIELRMPRHAVNFTFGRRAIQLELHAPRELRSNTHTCDGSITAQARRGDTRLATRAG